MTKRIFRSIITVAAAVLLACLFIIMGVLYEYFTSIQSSQLRAQTALAAQGAQKEGVSYFDGMDEGVYRFTWIGSDGTVLYDSIAETSSMENHAQREEIAEAFEQGTGQSSRYSATLAERTLYYALRLEDGTVLRTSVTQYTVLTLVLGILRPLALVLILAVILSAILAKRMSRRIVEPLNKLDLERPLENEAYEELSGLLTRIESQHRLIKNQLAKLKQKQDEFDTVTGSMSEGLILLSAKGVVISINQAARGIFETDESCVGRDFLSVDRSHAVRNVIRTALQGGRAEVGIELKGREYQIVVSPILSEGILTGAALLAFDRTDRAFAELQRREFSANVSHELKTPLQSIMGSAELMENKLVKPEDMPRFVEKIRSESSRLVMLIDDIIRLSQLDEGAGLPREDVDLFDLAKQTAISLASAASARSINLEVIGSSIVIYGVRRLLYDIIFNLCENAIKYNRENGLVTVTVTAEEKNAILSVSDTGIGIAPEHKERVFERFYRVDKSHSKNTGGTGLGLSIVKHAAQYHKATIDLKSAPGKGTTITVSFPR